MADDQRFSLAPMFSVVGLVGGWLTAESGGPEGGGLHGMLAIITPVVAGALGMYLSRRIERWQWQTLDVIACVLAAGAVNGALIGTLIAPVVGTVVGLPVGFVWAIAFVPPLVAIVWARGAVRARPASTVDDSHQRLVWVLTLALVAVATAPVRGRSFVTPHMGLIATALLVPILATAISARGRVRRLEARLAAAGHVAQSAPELALASSAAAVDLGVGDEYTLVGDSVGPAYRDTANAAAVFRGDVRRARSFVEREVTVIAVVLVGLACFQGYEASRARTPEPTSTVRTVPSS